MTDLITQSLTTKQNEKVEKDLEIIDQLTKKGKELGLRIIISGGYAVDGYLKQITRFHDEVDVQIYGQSNDALTTVLQLLASIGLENEKLKFQDKGRKEFYHNFVVTADRLELDIYYFQTQQNPFEEEKILIRVDGSLTKNHPYNTEQGEVNGITFEIQDALTEVVDKIYKRDHRGDPKLEKHEQDIANLKKFIPGEQIKKKLQSLL